MTSENAIASLTSPRFPATEIPDKPGLYAIYAEPRVWKELGLGTPPDSRPLYVGKAEESLYRREFQTHFGGGKGAEKSTTGSSTVRRSFAALLKDKFGFAGVPRNLEKPGYFHNFGLLPGDDRKLTDWMADSLLVSVWCPEGEVHLGDVETEVLAHWVPPLNLSKVKTPWKSMLTTKRKAMADEARDWSPEGVDQTKGPEPTAIQLEWSMTNPTWKPILRFDAGERLAKGRRTPHYSRVRSAARTVPEKHGCYSWWVGQSLAYVGSFSPYAKKEFETGLEGRLHNYLQNHGSKDKPNTNKWVFNKLCESMQSEPVQLKVLRFDEVRVNGRVFRFDEATNDKSLILALESMLIATGRLSGDCEWNRT